MFRLEPSGWEATSPSAIENTPESDNPQALPYNSEISAPQEKISGVFLCHSSVLGACALHKNPEPWVENNCQ